MAVQAHEGRTVLIEKISGQLGAFLSAVEVAKRNNLLSRNVAAETTMAGLLNLIHDWNLVNANAVKANYPAVDLIDTGARVAVQVTSTNGTTKLDHTLAKFAEHHLEKQFDRVILAVINGDAPTAAMQKREAPCFSGKNDIWNIPTLLSQIMELDAVKLARIHEYLTREIGVFTARTRLRLPPYSTLDTSGFVGRETELAEIRKRLDRGDKVIILSGLGGMGKTELAVQFGRNYRRGVVHFTRFSDSFTHTVASMSAGIRPALTDEEAAQPEEALLKMVLAILEEHRDSDILIIDNVDADTGSLTALMKDPAFAALQKLDLRLILTTRFDRDQAVEIDPLPEETLFEIFRKHGADLDEAQMRSLIDAVCGHTLTIDLMARTLNGKGWRRVTPEMMLDAIRSNTLPDEKYRKIASDYSQSPDQAQIYQHLSVVFDAAGVPEDGKNVLRCATLLPADGMNGEYFGSALPEQQQDALDELIDHGWLTAEDGIITIHPVVRLVCREELNPSDESCQYFLLALWTQIDRNEYNPVKLSQFAELFTLAADTLEDKAATWVNCGGRLWNELAQPKKAAALYEKHLPTMEERLPDSHALATAYSNLGNAFGALGNLSQAQEYHLKALHIKEKSLPEDHLILATSYNNMGVICNKSGAYPKALEYHLKALRIRQKNLQADHPDLADSYSNISTSYGHLGDHQKALEYTLMAMQIREKILPEDHPHLATSYNNTGFAYHSLGDHKMALEYHLKALKIREQVLPADHPELAISCNNVGTAFGNLGNYQKALEYKLRALQSQENSLPEDHPDLASFYNNIGYTHGKLGDHKMALEYQLKAMYIREQVLREDHPDLVASYQNVGYAYFQMGMFAQALDYSKKALALLEKTMPEGHPDTKLIRQFADTLELLIALEAQGHTPQSILKLIQ